MTSRSAALILFATLALLMNPPSAQAGPTLTKQPIPRFVSLGDNVTFTVLATSEEAMTFQWRFGLEPIAGATNRVLTLTNAVPSQAGEYSVVVSDPTGATTSNAATLDVDPTFARILTGPGSTLATESASWVDYDGDGRLDLLVVGGTGGGLYRNAGPGGFVKIVTAFDSLVTTADASGAVWGDYDNDGRPDLFVPQGWDLGQNRNGLFHNDGGGKFTRVTQGRIATDTGAAFGGAWGDYDGDGWLDLFVPVESPEGGPGGNSKPVVSFLYHNRGDGTFTRITNGILAELATYSNAATWGDFNNDGRLDLFVSTSAQSALYENKGGGEFESLGMGGGTAVGAAFGDFDNDGFLDLLRVRAFDTATLFRNDGNGSLVPIDDAAIATPDGDNRRAVGCAWADFDNDGWLDFFIPHSSQYDKRGADNNDGLYHNNGDGTFTRVNRGSYSFEGQNNDGAAWGDFNDDGFPDLFVANLEGRSGLYLNNGNTNHWLAINLVPTVSNRSAIGTKVRVKATIRGQTFWQLRQVSGGEGWTSQNDPRPHFGLGDAAVAEAVRIEWPSGQVTELKNVAARQFLTVTEPGGRPRLGISREGVGTRVTLTSTPHTRYSLEASPDFGIWTPVGTLETDDTGSGAFQSATAGPARFFRARVLP